METRKLYEELTNNLGNSDMIEPMTLISFLHQDNQFEINIEWFPDSQLSANALKLPEGGRSLERHLTISVI